MGMSGAGSVDGQIFEVILFDDAVEPRTILGGAENWRAPEEFRHGDEARRAAKRAGEHREE